MTDSPLIGRDDEIRSLWRLLDDHSVLLTGPRRVGKTSVLRQMHHAPTHGWQVVLVDLQGARTEEDLFRRWREATPSLAKAEVEAAAGAAGALRAATGQPSAPGVSAWEGLNDLLSTQLRYLNADTERVLVALDEVPWWLDSLDTGGAGSARTALAQLRGMRRRWPDRVRMLLTGSVGLSGLAADLGASAEINDLHVHLLPPLDRAAGKTLFTAEVGGRGLIETDEAAVEAWRLAGGLPFWIKELATRAATGRRPGPLDAASVGQAADDLLQPALRHLFQDEAREHFLRRDPADVAALQAMLDAAADFEASFSEEALLQAAMAKQPTLSRAGARELVYRLSDAWYVQPDGDGMWQWVNPLFQRWWVRYGRDR